jgi:hypothetical protein
VGVLPDVLTADHGIFSEPLLEVGVELVAVAGGEGSSDAGTAIERSALPAEVLRENLSFIVDEGAAGTSRT